MYKVCREGNGSETTNICQKEIIKDNNTYKIGDDLNDKFQEYLPFIGDDLNDEVNLAIEKKREEVRLALRDECIIDAKCI